MSDGMKTLLKIPKSLWECGPVFAMAAIFMRDLYRLCLDAGGGRRLGKEREIRANECTT